MIVRLHAYAQNLGLKKNDLFVLTLIHMIKTKLKSYELGVRIGESVSIKSFVKEVQEIINKLIIVKEEFHSF